MSKNSNTNLGISLLWKDYDHISKSLAENENVGEKRITFFLTLTTAIITAIITFNTTGKISTDIKLLTSISAIFTLLAIGLIILLRMIKRNKITDEYKIALDSIRQRIKDFSGSDWYLRDYTLLGQMKPGPLRGRNGKKTINRKNKPRKLGSLTHIMAILNSALATAIIGLIIFHMNVTLAKAILLYCILPFIILFITLFIIQYLFVFIIEKKNRKALRKHLPTHAGGVVYRMKKGELQIMLVTAKNKDDIWVLPKGHIIKHEGHGECAIREVWEESGWITSLVQPIATTTYSTSEKIKIVKYYLMTPERQLIEPENISDEGRKVKWMSFVEANEKISKKATDMKDILALAYTMIQGFIDD